MRASRERPRVFASAAARTPRPASLRQRLRAFLRRRRKVLAAAALCGGLVAFGLALWALTAAGDGAARPEAGAAADGGVQAAGAGVVPGLNTPQILSSAQFAHAPAAPEDAGRPMSRAPGGKFDEAAPRSPGQSGRPPGRTSFELVGPYEIIDGRTFATPAMMVALAQIEAPDRGAVCLDGDGRLWGCGLRARAALANLLRGQALTCAADLSRPEPAEATCRSSSGDVAAQMVLSGFARSEAAAFASEQTQARAARRGLWNGDWRVRTDPGPAAPSGADPSGGPTPQAREPGPSAASAP